MMQFYSGAPMHFVSGVDTSWRNGVTGALRMGLLHGAYCLGCCWLLFVVLFPLGIMNIAAMAVITLVIFAEKVLPWGRPVARATAAALVTYGAVVLVAPHALPTFTASGGVTTNPPAAPMDMQNMPMSGSATAPPKQ